MDMERIMECNSKHCKKCNLDKSLSGFYQHPQTADGYFATCKACVSKAAADRYANPAIRERCKTSARWHYRNSEKVRARAAQLKKGKRHASEQTKQRARWALQTALKRGKIVKPAICQRCCATHKTLHGHHHHGYAKEHALDVLWVCPECHGAVEPLRQNRKAA
jgi:hypothetical protein